MTNIIVTNNTEHFSNKEREILVGDFYWIPSEKPTFEKESNCYKEINEIGYTLCVVENIQSNVVIFYKPSGRGYSTYRLFYDYIGEYCIYEPNGNRIKEEFVTEKKLKISQYVNELRMLGASHNILLIGKDNTTGTDLVVRQDNINTTKYKNDLIELKKTKIPAIKDNINKESEALSGWLLLDKTLIESSCKVASTLIQNTDTMIHNVSLYAGLDEQILHIQKGNTAKENDIIHVFQTMLYMDEECLADYKTGGMEFNTIEKFDNWLLKKENLERILPFPKCIVAMQVRRKEKNRTANTLEGRLINFNLSTMDKYTYLYIRNGENVYCLTTDFTFDHLLFNKNLYMNSFKGGTFVHYESYSSIGMHKSYVKENEYKEGQITKDLIFKGEDELLNLYEDPTIENKRIIVLKKVEGDYVAINGEHFNQDSLMHSHYWYNEKKEFILYKDETDRLLFVNYYGTFYERYSQDVCAWFDEVSVALANSYMRENKFFVLLQGILDRADILNPHPQVNIYKIQNIDFIKLIKDGENILHSSAEAPNIDEYLKELNKEFKVGDWIYGHRELWKNKELKSWNKSRKTWREEEQDYYSSWMSIASNPGPTDVCQIKRIINKHDGSKELIVEWEWEHERYIRYEGYVIKKKKESFKVSSKDVYNLSNYKKDDYKKFYLDGRTRQNYLNWAGVLLRGEDLLNGKFTDKYL